jgi:ATP-dependent Clp protease ATP-binding subunit ClpA
LKEYFSPEFLNRIDKTIVFNALDKKSIKKIIIAQIEKLNKRLVEQQISIEVSETII